MEIFNEGEAIEYSFTIGGADTGSVFVLFTDAGTVIQRVQDS